MSPRRSNHRLLLLAALLGGVALAAGCGSRRGATTVPKSPAGGGIYQQGTASWYGKKFHGRRTASGERYDMHELTAAHRSLPFGAMIRVVNLGNGRSVVVRINDRGPFVEGRVIDLSYAAAKQLDMIRAGLVSVELYLLE